jgi:FAD-dependent oxidoreductase family protein
VFSVCARHTRSKVVPMRRPAARFFLLFRLSACAFSADHNFDVVVYGGTAGGVMAAVSSAREGLKTALVAPERHLGGMVSGGLGFTDYGKKDAIGGDALEFYLRVGKRYQLQRYGQEIGWLHEPHVAEEIFGELLREAGVQVFAQTRLREKSGVRKQGVNVAELVVENGDSFAAKVFIDSSYEGDLMAQSGIAYTYGREAAAQYGETLAGVRDRTPLHQFLVSLSPFDGQGNCCPRSPRASYPRREPPTRPSRPTTIARASRKIPGIAFLLRNLQATTQGDMSCSRASSRHVPRPRAARRS